MEVAGVKLREHGLAQNKLSESVSCHDNCYHDYHCGGRRQGLCLAIKECQVIWGLVAVPGGGGSGSRILRLNPGSEGE